jgi:transposase
MRRPVSPAQSENPLQGHRGLEAQKGDRTSHFCVLDEGGMVVERGKVQTTREGLRIALEVGTHSPWVSRLLKELGHEVLVANPRKTRLIYENRGKQDSVDAEALARIARLTPEVHEALSSVLTTIEVVSTQILALEHPGRFRKSRAVGPYLGLVPARSQSGDSDPQLRITKEGDSLLRRLLVQSAQYILGPFGEDCDLRRFGQALSVRGERNAKKRAVVAVARKLAVLLHRRWRTGEVYEPFHKAPTAHDAAAAA